MNRDEAREYFKNCGLTYDDITMNRIYQLVKILNKKIAESSSPHLIMINEPKVNGRYKDIKIKNDKFIEGYIKVKGTYFDDREAISFNEDGFIGIAGWAGGCNVPPFVEGLIEWCDYMKEVKNEI